MQSDVMDDFIEQAWSMSSVVIHGEKIPEDIFDQRMSEVQAMFKNLSPDLVKSFKTDYAELMEHARSARRVLRGEDEPEPIRPDELILADDDVITKRNQVGTPAWRWWVAMYQFVEGQRRGQEHYDANRQVAISLFSLTSPLGIDDDCIELDPYDLVLSPNDGPYLAQFYRFVLECHRFRAEVLCLGSSGG